MNPATINRRCWQRVRPPLGPACFCPPASCAFGVLVAMVPPCCLWEATMQQATSPPPSFNRDLLRTPTSHSQHEHSEHTQPHTPSIRCAYAAHSRSQLSPLRPLLFPPCGDGGGWWGSTEQSKRLFDSVRFRGPPCATAHGGNDVPCGTAAAPVCGNFDIIFSRFSRILLAPTPAPHAPRGMLYFRT